jgi:hypothetical protein
MVSAAGKVWSRAAAREAVIVRLSSPGTARSLVACDLLCDSRGGRGRAHAASSACP